MVSLCPLDYITYKAPEDIITEYGTMHGRNNAARSMIQQELPRGGKKLDDHEVSLPKLCSRRMLMPFISKDEQKEMGKPDGKSLITDETALH